MSDHVDTTQELSHISLCAGYGGLDLGLARVFPGLRTIAYSEIEEFACGVLVSHMEAGRLHPAPIWTDLKTFPFGSFRGKVDVLSGGFPCQPFSCAGKRDADADPRHLFPAIAMGIAACEPGLVVLENVEGILSRKLNHWSFGDAPGTPVALHVLRRLEALGYRATLQLASASEVLGTDGDGSPRCVPHQRKRVFFVAYRDGCGGWQDWLQGELWPGRAEQPSGNCRAAGSTEGGEVEGEILAVARPGERQHGWEQPRVV